MAQPQSRKCATSYMNQNETTPNNSETSQKEPLFTRNFTMLWAGQSISDVGDGIFTTSLVLWIAILTKDFTWTALAISGLFLATTIPTLLLGPVAGVVVDRTDKKKLMLKMDLLRALLVASLLVVAPGLGLFGQANALGWQLGIIYVIVFLNTICSQFFRPSRFSLLGSIIPETVQTRAIGLMQVTQNINAVVGPPIATLLFFGLGIETLLVFNACSFLVSFATIYLLKLPTEETEQTAPQTGWFADMLEGLKFIFNNRILRTITITDCIVMLGAGFVLNLDILFLTKNLHTDASLYGFLGSVEGIGAILGGVCATWLGSKMQSFRTYWILTLALGVVVVGYSRTTSFSIALLIVFCIGLITSILGVLIGPILLKATPRHLIGRVFSVVTTLAGVVSVTSSIVAGMLVTVLGDFKVSALGTNFGPIDTAFTIAGLLAIIGGLYAQAGFSKKARIEPEPTKEAVIEAAA